MMILIFYVTVGSWMEKKHFIIGHETGVLIIFGIVLSLILDFFDEKLEN